MTELLTAAQMRAIEKAAIDSGEVTGLELMERAGRGVVEAVFEEWPELAAGSYRAVVLCGPGNNGGDGFVVARLLTEWGWEVEVFLYGDPEKLPPDAKVNYERWCEKGDIRDFYDDDLKEWEQALLPANLVVDAIFGTGLTRNVPENSGLWCAFNSCVGQSFQGPTSSKVVAIDNPSRLASDTGEILDTGHLNPMAPTANVTVTFHRPKVGLYLRFGPLAATEMRVADIGLDGLRPAIAQAERQNTVKLNCPFLSRVSKPRVSHKYTHGHSLILSGGPGKGGAGRLAARGALRIGAGLVTLGCPPAALQENAAQLNAIMLKPLGSDEDLSLLLDGDTRINALCLGPGLGTGARERQMVAAALAAKRQTVLDADALTLVAGDTTLLDALHDGCILTPHHGEFARLFPDIAEKLNVPAVAGPACSKVDATRDAAKRAGCTVLFKGPDTVIADPSGQCAINSAQYDRAAPWLATAGSGDVLAGFITGLLARGFSTQQAAETAAWLHVECALKFGSGLIAEDLPEMLPRVFRDLGV